MELPACSVVSVAALPDELLLHVLSFLDIPDLLNASRINHRIRTLTQDPLLHTARLARASSTIERYIPVRPSLAELMVQRIYITRTTLVARNLGRNLIKIKLNRQLSRRPSPEALVQKGVLPSECLYHEGRKGRGVGGWVAPSLIETKRRVEKEKVKDGLRRWIEEKWRTRGSELRDVQESERPDVRRIARRFAREKERDGNREPPRWGRRVEIKELPTRAKVLGLRRFWETVGREGVGA